MDIKDELRDCIRGHLGETASSLFLERALGKLDGVETDRRNLMDASGRVVKMIQLFIDDKLAEEVKKTLQRKIDQSGLP